MVLFPKFRSSKLLYCYDDNILERECQIIIRIQQETFQESVSDFFGIMLTRRVQSVDQRSLPGLGGREDNKTKHFIHLISCLTLVETRLFYGYLWPATV